MTLPVLLPEKQKKKSKPHTEQTHSKIIQDTEFKICMSDPVFFPKNYQQEKNKNINLK